MLSPSRQEVITQSTNGVAITKSARMGCRHQVDQRSSQSRLKERGHQVNPGAWTPSEPKGRGHQVITRAGKTSQPKSGRGHQVAHRGRGGDTKSTHGEREGTPSQPKSWWGHQVAHRARGHQVSPREKGARINWSIERGRLGGKHRAHSLIQAKKKGWRSSIVYQSKVKENYRLIDEEQRRKSQCQLPKPQRNAEYRYWSLLLAMGAGEANGGPKPPATCPSLPAPNTKDATGPNP